MSALQKQLNDYDDKLCAADRIDSEIEQVSSEMYDSLLSTNGDYAYEPGADTVSFDDFMWDISIDANLLRESMLSDDDKLNEFNDKMKRELVKFCDKKAKEILMEYYL